jgi:hypothetical protein
LLQDGRDPALSNLAQTPSHLQKALNLGLTHRRPLATAPANVRLLMLVKGIDGPMSTVALPWASHEPARLAVLAPGSDIPDGDLGQLLRTDLVVRRARGMDFHGE